MSPLGAAFVGVLTAVMGSVQWGEPDREQTSASASVSDAIEMPSVVLVRARIDAGSTAWRGAELRIAADLRAAGFEVIDVVDPEWPGPNSRPLDERARFHRAAASVRVRQDAEGGEIELWIAKRGDRPAHADTTRVADPARSVAAEEAALYTVEVLFAGVLELPAAAPDEPALEQPDPVDAEEAAIEVAPRPAPHRQWSIRLAAMGTASPGGAGPFVGLGLGATLFALPQVGIDVLLNGAAGLRAIGNEDGRARWRHGALRLGVLGRPWPNARVSPALGVAFGGWGITLDGDANGSNQGRRVTTFAGLPTLMARTGVRLGAHWRLHIGTLVAWSLRRVIVQFDGREVASAGAPLVDVALGLEYQLR